MHVHPNTVRYRASSGSPQKTATTRAPSQALVDPDLHLETSDNRPAALKTRGLGLAEETYRLFSDMFRRWSLFDRSGWTAPFPAAQGAGRHRLGGQVTSARFGDPTRLRILELFAREELSVGELVGRVRTGRSPRVSEHLAWPALVWVRPPAAASTGRSTTGRRTSE